MEIHVNDDVLRINLPVTLMLRDLIIKHNPRLADLWYYSDDIDLTIISSQFNQLTVRMTVNQGHPRLKSGSVDFTINRLRLDAFMKGLKIDEGLSRDKFDEVEKNLKSLFGDELQVMPSEIGKDIYLPDIYGGEPYSLTTSKYQNARDVLHFVQNSMYSIIF